MAAKPQPSDSSRKYSFTRDEEAFLKTRWTPFVEHSVITESLDLAIRDYIVRVVCRRVGIDAKEYDVAYNISEGTLTARKKAKPKVATTEKEKEKVV